MYPAASSVAQRGLLSAQINYHVILTRWNGYPVMLSVILKTMRAFHPYLHVICNYGRRGEHR